MWEKTTFKIEVDEDLYIGALSIMEEEKLLDHYQENIVEESYEQCILIKNELDKRKINVIIT
jgi:hypothetical protein